MSPRRHRIAQLALEILLLALSAVGCASTPAPPRPAPPYTLHLRFVDDENLPASQITVVLEKGRCESPTVYSPKVHKVAQDGHSAIAVCPADGDVQLAFDVPHHRYHPVPPRAFTIDRSGERTILVRRRAAAE